MLKSTALKRNKIHYVSFFFLLFVLLQSCMERTEIDFPSLEEDAKLVVYGAITPGKDVNIFVARTLPIDIENTKDLEVVYLFDAEVWLYNISRNDSIRLQLSNDTVSNYGCSTEGFEITKGESYQLYVNVDGYPSVSAGTTVPEVAAVWEEVWELSTVSVLLDGDYYDDYIFTGSWKILPDDQYQFVTNHFIFEWGMSREDYNFNYDITDSIARFESETFPSWKSSEHLTYFTLVTADKNLYTYAENFTFYNEVHEEVYDSEDGIYIDLFRGIMPEYTNIEGGYGIFGSYLEDSVVIYEPGE